MGKGQRHRKRVRPRVGPTPARAEGPAALTTAPSRPEESPRPLAAFSLEEVVWLVEEQRRLCDRERQVVAALVAAGTSWPVIAAALGVSRQGARQRFLRTHER